MRQLAECNLILSVPSEYQSLSSYGETRDKEKENKNKKENGRRLLLFPLLNRYFSRYVS